MKKQFVLVNKRKGVYDENNPIKAEDLLELASESPQAGVFTATENGLVPAPGSGTLNSFLQADGTWVTITPVLIGAEPAFNKNTGFNLNLGTTTGTVMPGNWRPSWNDVTGKPSFNTSNWDAAYDWGDHSNAGYLTQAIAEGLFLQRKATTGEHATSSASDLDIVTTSMFYASTTALNRPPVGNSHVLSQSYSNDYIQQIAGRAGRLFFRHKEAGNYGAWKEIWHSGNLSKYNHWRLGANGSYTNIENEESVNFYGQNGASVTRTGNTIIIEGERRGGLITKSLAGEVTITANMDKCVVRCYTANIALKIPAGLPDHFSCTIINHSAFNYVSLYEASGVTLEASPGFHVAPLGGVVRIAKQDNTDFFYGYGDFREPSSSQTFAGCKEVKTVTQPSLSFLASDVNYWQNFTNNCTVTISGENLPKGSLIEGSAEGSTVTFQAASGTTIFKSADIGLTLSPGAVFGIKFVDNYKCVLYGTDPV